MNGGENCCRWRCRLKSVVQQNAGAAKNSPATNERGTRMRPRSRSPAFPPASPIPVVKDLCLQAGGPWGHSHHSQCYRRSADRQGCAVEVTRISCVLPEAGRSKPGLKPNVTYFTRMVRYLVDIQRMRIDNFGSF